jgi:NAD(P)-dependent dehydrogenase (short-subunit alcohol dehydrogenase family)
MSVIRQRPSDSDFSVPSFRLDGRVALVTGGSRGLGLGIALALAEQGADIALAARGADELEQAAEAIRARGRRALPIAVDIGARDAPEMLVERTVSALGGLDVLINGAGINLRKPAGAFRREDFEGLMRINLEAAFFISQAAGQVMRERRWGRVICIGSIAAEVAIPNIALYAMSKGGLRQMVKSLALEWARDGVTVNAIAPGRFWTKMTDAVFSDDRLYESAVRVIPMGRPGVPADLAGAAVLLASDAGSYITGQSLVIDGGWLASGGVEG